MFEYSAGGFVFRKKSGRFQVLMIQDRYGWWTLPKGHIERGETPRQAAEREVREETGINAVTTATLPAVYYVFWKPSGRTDKFVHYFLMKAADGESENCEPVPQWQEIRQAVWMDIDELGRIRQYANNLPVMQAAATLLGAS